MNLRDIQQLPKFDQIRINHYKDITSTSDLHLLHTIILTLLHDHKQPKSKKDIYNLTRLSFEDIDYGIKLLFRNSKTDNKREGIPFAEKDRKYSLNVALSSLTWKTLEASGTDKLVAKTITDKIKARIQEEKETIQLDYTGGGRDEIGVDELDQLFGVAKGKENKT